MQKQKSARWWRVEEYKESKGTHSDLLYRLCIRRDVGDGAAGEMAAHDIESGQVGEGDGDEEREDESTEEEEDAREEKGTGSHDWEPWTSC
jgi:hypothetical protein